MIDKTASREELVHEWKNDTVNCHSGGNGVRMG